MKRIILALLAGIILCSFSACGGNTSDRSTIKDMPETSDSPIDAVKNESADDGGYYANKVYYAGEDLPVGGYVINCTGAEYSMEVLVFASAEDYKGFQDANKFTNGEYRQAVETYAWTNFYLKQDEKTYVGMREGYIILLDGGRCEFGKYDPTVLQTIYPGIYVVGEDISEGKINIRCDSDYLNMNLFDSKDNYLNYHKTDRFTNGEEADAIEKYASSATFARKDDSAYVNLREGMVMMIEYGMGEYSVDEGPAIVSADFKEMMDSYEAFFDEYCDFVSQYTKDPTDLTVLTRYTEFANKATEMNEAFEAWGEKDLTTEETAYYLEVSNRVMQKILSVAG